jgi:DNA repair exonuclease SbcCD ATPase subunit
MSDDELMRKFEATAELVREIAVAGEERHNREMAEFRVRVDEAEARMKKFDARLTRVVRMAVAEARMERVRRREADEKLDGYITKLSVVCLEIGQRIAGLTAAQAQNEQKVAEVRIETIQEVAEAQKRTNERIADLQAEAAEAQKETNKRIAEVQTETSKKIAEAQAQMNQKMTELAAVQLETSQKVAELAVAQARTEHKLESFIDALRRGGNGAH